MLNNLKLYLKNKNICLLGNSKSILITEKNIDSYDIVCRINKGYPRTHEKYIGSRTDVLFLATRLEDIEIRREFHPQFVIWTTKSTELQSEWVRHNAIQNPVHDWEKVKSILTTLPSTGCIAIYFLLKYIEFKTLTIYGFDFFRSGTWYHNTKQKWHNGELEEKYIMNLIKNDSRIHFMLE
jgi:hypothetical protein